jgi:hypothetical protein
MRLKFMNYMRVRPQMLIITREHYIPQQYITKMIRGITHCPRQLLAIHIPLITTTTITIERLLLLLLYMT